MKFFITILLNIISNCIKNVFEIILKRYGVIFSFVLIATILFTGYKLSTLERAEKVEMTASRFHQIKNQADNGDIKAQIEIGYLYLNGIYVSVDYNKAFMYYMKAAKQGNALAQYQIGRMYHNDKDYYNAYLYYKLSELNGNSAAYLFGMYEIQKEGKLSMTEIAKITVEAQKIFERQH